MLATLGRYQENSYVRGCETSRVLCPFVSGLGNLAVGIIRTFGYIYNAAMNGYYAAMKGINNRIFKIKDYQPRPVEFKSAINQIAWGILMSIPYFGSEIGRIRLGAVANDTAKRVAVLEQASTAQAPAQPSYQNQTSLRTSLIGRRK